MEKKEYKYHIINREREILYVTNDFADASFNKFILQEKGFDCLISFNPDYNYSVRKAESNNEHQHN